MNLRMNRTHWVLSGLLALFLALSAGLLILVNAGATMGHGDETRNGQFVTVPSPAPPLTAREGYLASLPTARAWAADAQLWWAQATWSPERDLQAPASLWSYTFYSVERKAAITVNVTQENVQLLRERPVTDAPDLASVDGWQIDSPAAFDLLYESGGEAFLTVHPRRTMILTLHADAPLRWRANLINEGALGNADGRQLYGLLFSAQDGRLITTPLEGEANEDA